MGCGSSVATGSAANAPLAAPNTEQAMPKPINIFVLGENRLSVEIVKMWTDRSNSRILTIRDPNFSSDRRKEVQQGFATYMGLHTQIVSLSAVALSSFKNQLNIVVNTEPFGMGGYTLDAVGNVRKSVATVVSLLAPRLVISVGSEWIDEETALAMPTIETMALIDKDCIDSRSECVVLLHTGFTLELFEIMWHKELGEGFLFLPIKDSVMLRVVSCADVANAVDNIVLRWEERSLAKRNKFTVVCDELTVRDFVARYNKNRNRNVQYHTMAPEAFFSISEDIAFMGQWLKTSQFNPQVSIAQSKMDFPETADFETWLQRPASPTI